MLKGQTFKELFNIMKTPEKILLTAPNQQNIISHLQIINNLVACDPQEMINLEYLNKNLSKVEKCHVLITNMAGDWIHNPPTDESSDSYQLDMIISFMDAVLFLLKGQTFKELFNIMNTLDMTEKAALQVTVSSKEF